MATLISGAVAVVVLYLLLQMLRNADPAALARLVKIAGGVGLLAVAAFTGLRGEIAVAIPLGLFGAGLLGWTPAAGTAFGDFASRFGGRGARTRTDLIELSAGFGGRLSGRFIAGSYAGRALDSFSPPQLIALRGEVDAASAALLEHYLDSRAPGWRQHAEADPAARDDRRSTARGKMSDQEAYQILGLQPGAAPDAISRAHRALMKKFHPDQGGTTYLAARINEAKDTLLRTHRG